MSQITEPLRCLQKTEDCNSLKCKRIVECTDPEYSASCYAITQLNDKNKPEVLLADCWGRGDECNSPSLLIKKIENKIANELHHDDSYIDKLKSYDLSEHLKNASIQDKCIGYIDSNDHPYLIKNNRSFCCCTGHVCNANLAYAYERNPYLVFAEKMNPENIHNKANSGIDDNHGLNLFISARDLTMLCISGFICFFIMGVILALFFCLKKSSKTRKNSPHFSSVYYSRANSLNDLGNSNLSNSNHELTLIQNNDPFNYNANNLELIQLAMGDERQFCGKNQVEIENQPSVAPNVQILSNNDVLYHKKSSKKSQPTHSHIYSDNGREDFSHEILPARLKSMDILLTEKIAVGQFSSVWKARCHNTPDHESDPYAIKIFMAHQKTAWMNEKDIYNTMCASNENILKFYGSDTNECNKSEEHTPFMASIEYWLITEYHSIGSLHDFLKINSISWSQMISLAYCFFDGLAFLHSESSSIQKSFAIAHRDLKSKNILVKSDGRSCCIGDFGLALKLQNKNKLSNAEIRSKVGTKRYMSPELIEGAIAFTKETFMRIDVYASALVLWEIISRGNFYDEISEYRLPFEDEVGSNPNLDVMKEIVVDKCQRPVIKSEWLQNQKLKIIAQTIEECWDIDLDARISAECAVSRIRKIYKAS